MFVVLNSRGTLQVLVGVKAGRHSQSDEILLELFFRNSLLLALIFYKV